VQLLYLGKLLRSKYIYLALNCSYSQCYNTRILTAKLSPYYFTYLLFNLRFRRFIADGKVVYQRVRREMRLASDNSWTRHSLKHLSWRSQWIILYTLERRMAVSCNISRADWCLFGLSSWLSTSSSPAIRTERGLPLPGSLTIVPILRILFSRLLMLQSFRPLSGNSLNSFHATYCFDR